MENDRYKFRVHILETGERLPVCDLSWRDGLFFTASRIVDKNHAEIVSGCIKAGVIELEQCTGLSAAKSYRGTEPEDLLIYEGDIIKPDYGMPKCVVAWHKIGWRLMQFPIEKECENPKCPHEKGTLCQTYAKHFMQGEIIGNVHEVEE